MNNVWLNKKLFNKIELTSGIRAMLGPRPCEDNPIDYGLGSFTENNMSYGEFVSYINRIKFLGVV